MALLLIKLNLRSVWHLFCLFFYTCKAVSSSAGEFKNQESIAVDSPTLDHDGDASVNTNRRAEQFFSNLPKSVHNFSINTTIKPPFGPNESVASLQWIGSPPNQRLIILYTTANENRVTGSNLFRSQPNGSMVNETYQFLQWQNAVIDSFFISNDPNKLLFRDLINHRLYMTADAGEHYNATQLKFLPKVIQFSHSNADYLFAIDNTSSNLHVSDQFGANDSWKIINATVKAAYWTQLKEGQNFDDPSTIYFAELNVQSGGYRIRKVMSPYQNSCIFHQEIGEVINFKLAYEYIFVTKNVTNGSTLFVSYKRGPFVQAKFIPTMDGNEHYSIVDASQGQVLLAVVKDDKIADLYISDEWGTNYSLSLQNVITNRNLQWNSGIESLDFYIVKGTRGTYIANVAVIETQQQSNELTVITFNKGAKWSPVTTPTPDSAMLPIEYHCPDCSLHLDIQNSGIVSKKSAVGMILARGTLGRGLSQNVGLYLSYDGGFSWRELLKTNVTNNTYLFDILDSGSVIIVITGFNYTSDFMISCDTGFTWKTYNIYLNNPADRIYMPELYTEMSDTASLTTIYGKIKYLFLQYVVFNLNISQLNINDCKDDDYDTWMPSDGRIGDRCVLGEKVTYYKRKPGHCCRNKPNYWLPPEPMMCKCTIEDYGCDVGFQRTDCNSLCTPVDGYYPLTPRPTDCNVSNYYSSSNGYRRIAGDICIATGNDYFNNELVQPCPTNITVYGLKLMATPSVVAVNQLVTLFVTKGSNMENYTYSFSFGDMQRSEHNSDGSVVHSYSMSGTYQAFVIIQGSSVNVSFKTSTLVTVQDSIITVCVNANVQSLIVTFIAIIDCEVSSDKFYGVIQYTWKFGNGKNVTTCIPSASTKYQSMGTYTFSVLVSNNVSESNYTEEINITTETDTTNVQLDISGPRFAVVNNSVMFSVITNVSVVHDLTYIWKIIDQEINQVYNNITYNELVINVTFTKSGTYEVLVSVNYNESIFNSSHTISIENKIQYIKVKFPAVIKVNQRTILYTCLYDIHNNSYEGIVNISITQSNVLQYAKSPIIIQTYISYNVSSIYEVKITANNHVSEVSISFTVEVVCTNTTILLEFSFIILSQANVNYESTSWRKLFSDVIDVSLTNESDLPSWQLTATADNVRNKSGLEIFVDVLPMSSSSKALATATMIAMELIDIVNENYTFLLPNSNVSIYASSATIIGLSHGATSDNETCYMDLNTTESPTEGIPSHTYSHADNNSLELGVGIGVPALVSVVSILIGFIYCRRKFNCQRKQYGRLRTSYQTSLFIDDDADTGLERTDDVPMDEIVLYEASL